MARNIGRSAQRRHRAQIQQQLGRPRRPAAGRNGSGLREGPARRPAIHRRGEPEERALLLRRHYLARAGSGQWRGDRHRNLRHALLTMRRGGLALALLLLAAGVPAAAQPLVVSPGPEAASVTVYRNPDRRDSEFDLDWLEGYALITET